ncbi:MAG: bifunctional folylpolyglutamate synthase/dihydrofolate synthase [Flavobacteriaceae bacterium]|nr:bifunctional folylpolyglutamate synthase/dihydrofolate synthase [Flavobacteriaceae bacterium]
MTYSETLDWLFSQLPMYQRVGKAAYKADLSNTIKLTKYLGNPENTFKSIHVAGTNGKGSTSHILASILQEAGYRVGLYTSPHLKDFRERIKINGVMISETSVTGFVTAHKKYFEANQVSFFEMTVGMAFDVFRREKVDIAVIEVGLGGRLDSTNIITPEVCAITNIGLDHTQFLGSTIEQIAREKAGIMKEEIPVVIGERQEETTTVFETLATQMKAPIYFAEDVTHDFYDSDLLGSYQQANQRTVLSVLQVLREKGWSISEKNIKIGLKKVVVNTGFLGRWQILQEAPKVICDTAHNKEGLVLTLAQLQREDYQNLHIVLGMVNDKDLNEILPLFPTNAKYYFCAPTIARALEVSILQEKAAIFNLKGDVYNSVKVAYQAALQIAFEKDCIYVGGSTFVVAEVL